MANAKGIDVSHWQTLTDWSPTGLSFVIAKFSEGTTKDAMYSKHVAKARASGLVVGAYAFNRDDVDINAQATTFAESSATADLFFIDVEGEYAFSISQTKQFMDKFRSLTGKRIGMYHSESGYFNAGQDYDWVAHWGVSSPSRSWDFHQYRGSPLDLDQYNGTAADLAAFVAAMNNGGSTVNAFTVPEDSTQVNVTTGSWLYDNSDLASSAGNIKLDPGRYLGYVGQFSTSPDIRIVAYEPVAGDVNTTSKAMFTARASISSFRKTPDTTPYDQEDIDAAVTEATAPLKEAVAKQAAIIVDMKNEIAALNEEVADLGLVIDQQDQTIMEQAVVIDEYSDLRAALRTAVSL